MFPFVVAAALGIALVPLAFLRLPFLREAAALYFYTAVTSLIPVIPCWLMARRSNGLVRWQWRLFAIQFVVYSAGYWSASAHLWGLVPSSTDVWVLNVSSAVSTALCLLTLTGFLGGATKWMRVMDWVMAFRLCWLYFLSKHGSSVAEFNQNYLWVGIAIALFLLIAAVASYLGATTSEEAWFVRAAGIYLALHAGANFLTNIVGYSWLNLQQQSPFDLLFGVPALGFTLLVLHELLQPATSSIEAEELAPNLMARSLLPSFVAVMAVLLALVVSPHYRIAASFAIVVTMAFYGWRTHLLYRKMMAEQTRLQERTGQLEQMVNYDALTGISNRRGLETAVRHLFIERPASEVALLLIDVDHFKRVNDTFGHQGGDDALVAVARLLVAATEKVADVCCARIGGDEFVALLPNTGYAGAVVIAERLRNGVEAAQLGDSRHHLSVSVGVMVQTGLATLVEMLQKADQALYRAKSRGRNVTEMEVSGVHGYSEPIPWPESKERLPRPSRRM